MACVVGVQVVAAVIGCQEFAGLGGVADHFVEIDDRIEGLGRANPLVHSLPFGFLRRLGRKRHDGGTEDLNAPLMGALDEKAHSFVADENTTFRKRRDPITLADIQVGDTVRAEGAIKEGLFLATSVNAMSPPQGGPPTGAPGAPAAPPQ